MKLASAQPARRRAARARAVAVPAAAKGHDADLDLPKAPAEAVEIGVEVVGDDGVVVAEKLPADAPAKLDAKELEEPTPEELEALSADMIGIDDPVRM